MESATVWRGEMEWMGKGEGVIPTPTKYIREFLGVIFKKLVIFVKKILLIKLLDKK